MSNKTSSYGTTVDKNRDLIGHAIQKAGLNNKGQKTFHEVREVINLRIAVNLIIAKRTNVRRDVISSKTFRDSDYSVRNGYSYTARHYGRDPDEHAEYE